MCMDTLDVYTHMTSCDMVTSPSEAIHMSQFGQFEPSENIFQKKREVVPFLATLKEETALGFETKYPFSQNWQEQRSLYGKHPPQNSSFGLEVPAEVKNGIFSNNEPFSENFQHNNTFIDQINVDKCKNIAKMSDSKHSDATDGLKRSICSPGGYIQGDFIQCTLKTTTPEEEILVCMQYIGHKVAPIENRDSNFEVQVGAEHVMSSAISGLNHTICSPGGYIQGESAHATLNTTTPEEDVRVCMHHKGYNLADSQNRDSNFEVQLGAQQCTYCDVQTQVNIDQVDPTDHIYLPESSVDTTETHEDSQVNGIHPSKRNTKLFEYIIHTSNGRRLIAMLDTGASITLMSELAAQRFATREVAGLNANLASTEASKISLNKVVDLKYKIGNFNDTYEFIVFPNLIYDIILGLDWLQRHNPMIPDWGSGILFMRKPVKSRVKKFNSFRVKPIRYTLDPIDVRSKSTKPHEPQSSTKPPDLGRSSVVQRETTGAQTSQAPVLTPHTDSLQSYIGLTHAIDVNREVDKWEVMVMFVYDLDEEHMFYIPHF